MQTCPLSGRKKIWHSAGEHVSAKSPADQGRQGASLLQHRGKPAVAVRARSAASSSVSGRDNDSQQAAWRKTLEVFDEQRQKYTTLSLFPEDRPVPAEAVDSVQVKLSEMRLRRARPDGNCWLGCELWRQLELDRFWEQKLAYEAMDGNTSDKTTLRGFLAKIEELYGKARRVWLMDRGVPTEAVLQEMRQTERQMVYLVGTPKARVTKYEKQWLELAWHKVRDSVEVKLFGQDGEFYVVAKSEVGSKRRSRSGARNWPGYCASCGGWALFAAHQSGGGRSGGAVGSLHAAHPDRGGLQMSEERVGHPADLSSTRASRGSAHSGGVSGVLSERDVNWTAECEKGTGSRPYLNASAM